MGMIILSWYIEVTMHSYFYGWYYRCQSDTQTLAIIPSVHKTKDGDHCAIQLIMDAEAFHVPFPYRDFRKDRSQIEIGSNRFEMRGSIWISIHLNCTLLATSGSDPFRHCDTTLWGPFGMCHSSSAGTAYLVWSTPFMEKSPSMVCLIYSGMLPAIWKVTGDIPFPRNIYGPSAASRKVLWCSP